VKDGDLVRGVYARFKKACERQGFSFASERHGMLVQANLPLGFCHFFYQDLHIRSPLVKDDTQRVASQELRL
jgi:hypothetical protein